MIKRKTQSAPAPSGGAAGFSLVEVMVAVIVLCVGLLGIARMQSVALSSTSIAAKRSLAAIEAASLAAMMHENRGYWTNSDASGATFTIKGTTVTVANGAPLLTAAQSPAPACTSTTAACTAQKLAAYDLNEWAKNLNAVLPGHSTSVACGTLTPVSCNIVIAWNENSVALNSQQSAAASVLQSPTYSLFVQP
ncbi:MAG: type IV pilus modification protein PilV [Steroidobacteraceae bacterium]